MEQPLVSIVMNCRNGEKYLDQALKSVLEQTYQNYELVFWDNLSSDSSAEIFKKYTDKRFKYFLAPTSTNLSMARNLAIEKTQGEFIAFLDVDDWWLPTKLAKQIPLFSDSSVGMVCSNYWVFSEKKDKCWKRYRGPLPSGWVLSDLLKDYFVGLPTLVIRKASLLSLDSVCNPNYRLISDLDLVSRLAVSWRLGAVQEALAYYRVHAANESSKGVDYNILDHEKWISDISQISAIKGDKSFRFAQDKVLYIKALHMIMQQDRFNAYKLIRDISWLKLKLKLYVASLLPQMLLNRIKN